MSKQTLSPPTLRRDETIVGWSYYAFQMIVLPSLLFSLNGLLKKPAGEAEVNFTYLLLNFLATLWIYHRFLGGAFRQAKSHPAELVQGVVLGLAAYWASFYILTWAIQLLDPSYVNQNDASIAGMTQSGYYFMVLGTVIFAPITEECVYRGLLFRNLWRTGPIVAYLVSMFAFSIVHIISYLGVYTPLQMTLAFLQYLPAGLCLAWCYVKSGSICGPILMHALINLYSINQLR